MGKTGNFIPTPSAQQLNCNLSLLLNIVCVEVYNSFLGFVHCNRIKEQKQAAERAGLPDWRPKTFGYNALWYENRKDFVFSKQNTTWAQNFRMCPQLPLMLTQFGNTSRLEAESICNVLHKSKWCTLPIAERNAIGLLKSEPEIFRKKNWQRLGSCIRIAKILYWATSWSLVLHLRDKNYLDLSGITETEIDIQMHSNFQHCVWQFRNSSGSKSALYNMDKYHKAARNA